jgi:hypothetical protein
LGVGVLPCDVKGGARMRRLVQGRTPGAWEDSLPHVADAWCLRDYQPPQGCSRYSHETVDCEISFP